MSKHCYFFDTTETEKDRLIFELVYRIFNKNEKVVIYTDTDERANDLERFLWVYKQEAFIPHKIFRYEEKDAMEKVAIVTEELNPIDANKIILDVPCSSTFASNFEVIFDFADRSSEKKIKESRMRYKLFRDMGYTMYYQKEISEV
ncbi:MAG: hypothetical protein OHK0040_10600 [bacterium]